MKKKPEILRAICDSIADGVKPLDAALLENISARAFFLWLRQSKENAADPALIVDWLGEPVPFASAVSAAREIAASPRPEADRAEPGPSANVVHHYHHFVFETASPPDGKPAPAPGEDAELDEMLNGRTPSAPAPVIPDKPAEPAPVIPDKPAEPVIPDKPAPCEARQPPAPLAFDEPPNHPARSDLERDLLARLALARARNAPATGKDTGPPEGGSADSAMAPGGVSTD